MAFCPNCGTQAEGRFCPKCGTPLPAVGGGPTPGPDATIGYTAPPPAAPAQSAGMTDNMACALCYLLGVITGVLFLVLEPYNKNRLIRFHAFQSIFLFVALFALSVIITIISVLLVPIPFVGWMFGTLLHLVFGLGCFILWLVLMYKAYNNEKWVLPVVGPLAEKQA